MTHGEDYIGLKVAGAVIAAVPPIAALDINDVGDRAVLALCGGLGALLAILGDRPKNWQDIVWRIVGGIVSCFLFGPYAAKRFGLNADFDGLVLTFGVVGVLSWYFLGAGTKLMIAWQESGGLGRAIRAYVRQWAGLPKDEPPPKEAK